MSFSYSKETSRNSTRAVERRRAARARASPASSASSSRSSRIRSRPAKASVTWLPIETIWIDGPTRSPRYSVNETNEPTVIRPASISWAPTHMIDTPTTPSSSVENAETAEKPVIVFATLRKSAVGALREDERLAPLGAVGLDDPDAGEGLRQPAGDLGVDLRALAEERPQRLERVEEDEAEEREDRRGRSASAWR